MERQLTVVSGMNTTAPRDTLAGDVCCMFDTWGERTHSTPSTLKQKVRERERASEREKEKERPPCKIRKRERERQAEREGGREREREREKERERENLEEELGGVHEGYPLVAGERQALVVIHHLRLISG